jgi:hypothetical protein
MLLLQVSNLYWLYLTGSRFPAEYIACSRRDDLESAALLLLHILTPGGLSWTRNGVPRDDAAHDRLKREKRAALPEDLARGLPEEFEEFLRYCRSLAFAEQPDYACWRKRFRHLANELGYRDGDQFIWPPPPTPVVSVHPRLAESKRSLGRSDIVSSSSLQFVNRSRDLNKVNRQRHTWQDCCETWRK